MGKQTTAAGATGSGARDLLCQMRIMMEEVTRREKAETWERVAQIERESGPP